MSPTTLTVDAWILLVDDEEIVLDVGARILEKGNRSINTPVVLGFDPGRKPITAMEVE